MILLKRHAWLNKNKPLVDQVYFLDANPQYACVHYSQTILLQIQHYFYYNKHYFVEFMFLGNHDYFFLLVKLIFTSLDIERLYKVKVPLVKDQTCIPLSWETTFWTGVIYNSTTEVSSKVRLNYPRLLYLCVRSEDTVRLFTHHKVLKRDIIL